MKKSRLSLLSVALLTLVLCVAAAPAQAENLYFGTSSGIYRIDTASPASAPRVVKPGAIMQFQGLAGSCEGSLFVMGRSISRVNTTTGVLTTVADDLGTGSPYGLVSNADGTRLWWATDAGNVYTRLVSDPLQAVPTAIVSGAAAEFGGVPLLARVGDKLVLRGTAQPPSAASILDAATATTTLNPVSGVESSTQVFIGSDLTHAYYEHESGGQWKVGSIDPTTGTVKSDVAMIAETAGLLAADAGSIWVFGGITQTLYKVDVATGTGGMTPVNSAIGGVALASAFTDCTQAPTPPATPAVTPAATTAATPPAALASAPHAAKPKPLKIFPVSGSATNPTIAMRVPGPGVVSLAGTMTSVDPLARFTGRATVPACTRVTKRVTKVGIVRVTCRVTADTQAARLFGPVTVRLVGTYKPHTGKTQTTKRTIILRALGTSESVTG